MTTMSSPSEVVDVADRLELAVDDHLVERLAGGARHVLHQPRPAEVVFTADAPWEGNTSNYFTLLQDGDEYRMYYRGSGGDAATNRSWHEEVTCLAVSRDGVQWTRPALGLHAWPGDRANNIIWTGREAHNFSPFLDGNPQADPAARYKAIARSGPPVALQSPDGIHWKLVSEQWLVNGGAFDSHNLAFWDAHRRQYRAYWRIRPRRIRGIRTGPSNNFTHWNSDQPDLTYTDMPARVEGDRTIELYTNSVQPYIRAPHLYVGFPARFLSAGAQVEPLLMTSRDGVHFHRWLDPVIPRTAPADRDGNRSNYMAWGMLQLPDRPDEISVYATECYYTPAPMRLRRFVYRLDGLVSIGADADGGEWLTPPLTFSGQTLVLNFAAPRGELRVELLDAQGRPIPGHTARDCQAMIGDSTHATVHWYGRSDLSALPQPLRLRFLLRDAQVFSIRFEPQPS
jgi:hypothetical protein